MSGRGNFSRADLEALTERFRAKAQHAHQDARRWQNRALTAEAERDALTARLDALELCIEELTQQVAQLRDELEHWRTTAVLAQSRLDRLEHP